MEERFFTPVQTDPAPHPACCTVGTGSFSRGVKRRGRGVDHTSPSSAEFKERVELYLNSPSGPSWTLTGRNLHLHVNTKFTVKNVNGVSQDGGECLCEEFLGSWTG